MKILLVIILVVATTLTACMPSITPPVAPTKLRIITETYPPFNFVDSNKNVVGKSTEIVEAILQELGAPGIPIEVMPLADGLSLAQKGPNVAIFSINRTPQRETLYKWVGPIGNYEQAFYARKGSSITLSRLEDAKIVGKIGVYKGDAGNQFLTAQGFTNLDESLNDVEALRKLIDNKVQLWLGNTEGLEITAREAGVNAEDIMALPVVAIRAGLYVAFSKDVSGSTVAAWQNALNSLKQKTDIDGKTVYDKINARYDDPDYIRSLLQK